VNRGRGNVGLKEDFARQVLDFDREAAVSAIVSRLREILVRRLKRRGLVLGVSGGIDSSVTAALCVRAVGRERVFALQMPERQSAPETADLSRLLIERLGIPSAFEEITPILDAVGFYRRYQEAVQRVLPEYGPGWMSKIVLPDISRTDAYSIFSIVARPPRGPEVRCRLTLDSYLGIVAATNFKQRVRKMLEYYHADRLNYAVAGTPNRLEYDQGFFVKLGDGAADVKPIAHLYKTQVYRLAEHLAVPEKICSRPPTTDTYSLAQGQDEFYFSLPYALMDICLFAKNHGYAPAEAAAVTGLAVAQAQRVFRDIDVKRVTTRYLHLPPQLAEAVSEIAADQE
jgi:NAD+ synthase